MSAVAATLGNRCTVAAPRTSSLRTKSLKRTTPLATTRARATTVMAAAAAGPPTYLLLTLDYVEDIMERRDPFRADHIAGRVGGGHSSLPGDVNVVRVVTFPGVELVRVVTPGGVSRLVSN